jgi:hypothetical protein
MVAKIQHLSVIDTGAVSDQEVLPGWNHDGEMGSNVSIREFYMFIPHELALRASRLCIALLSAAHLLALAGIWLAAIPTWLQWLTTISLVAGSVLWWRQHVRGPRGVRVTQSGQFEIRKDDWQPAVIARQPVVLPWLVGLSLEAEDGSKHRLFLWPDSADPAMLRRLRAWLKWGYQSRKPPRRDGQGND